MKSYNIKDLMVPVAEYATVYEDATLTQAIEALDEAQKNVEQYKHRAVIVLDKDKHIVGKISQHDVIQALEPNYKKIEKETDNITERFGISEALMKSAINDYNLWDKPLQNLCQKAGSQNVKDVMYKPGKHEFVSEDANLDEAIHRLIVGRHQSLLVTEGKTKKITGILRLTDVFVFITQEVKQCAI